MAPPRSLFLRACLASLLGAAAVPAAQEAASLPLVRGERLDPEDPDPGDLFGVFVAVAGSTIAVANPGPAEVEIFDETPGGWQRSAVIRMSGPFPVVNSIALEGDTLVVGSPPAYDTSGGRVRIFERDAGGPDQWGQVWSSSPPPLPFPWTHNRTLGETVAITGPYVFVSDPLRNVGLFPSGGPGVVFVFRAAEGGSSWNRVATIQAEGSTDFGRDMDADGDFVAIAELGTVRVYERAPAEDDWQLAQELASGMPLFGISLDLRGDLLLVGDPSLNGERVHLFRRDQGGPGAWGLVTTLDPRQPSLYTFGWKVALGEGVLYVGESTSLTNALPSVVHTFVADPGVPGGWRPGLVFPEPDPVPLSTFGFALEASDRLLVAGAPEGAGGPGRAWVLNVHQPEQSLAPALVPTGR